MSNFTKKTILITGSGTGIGRDTAFALAKKGHHVIATTLKENESLDIAKVAKEQSLEITTYKLDVTSNEDRNKILEHNFIDVLINNAGIGYSGSLAEISLEKVRENFEVNLFSPLELTQLVLKKMIPKNKGTVIFISSTAGRVSLPFLSPYSMTKFSLSSGAEALRNEIHCVKSNVHVSLIEPGAYHTGFNQRMISTQFESMDENSYFISVKEAIRKKQTTMFDFIEMNSTKSIVDKIVKAAESNKPRLRYSAPWWQSFGVRILRILGK